LNAAGPAIVTSEHWRSLHYFNVYRLVLATTLVTLSLTSSSLGYEIGRESRLVMGVIAVLALLCVVNFFTIRRARPPFALQANYQTAFDLVLIALLMHGTTGIDSGFGILMIVSVAGAGVLLPRHVTATHAAFGSLLALAEQTTGFLWSGGSIEDFTDVGLLGIGLFTTGLVVATVAQRVRRSEELAERRAVDLANLDHVNRLIVDLVDTAIIVVDGDHRVRLINNRARALLGVEVESSDQTLETLVPELGPLLDARDTRADEAPTRDSIEIRGSTLIPRVESTGSGHLIFLEDISALQEQSRRLRLAALGRLAAALAHEIRNPLAAISHASELLDESGTVADEDRRLTRIIATQTNRIESTIKAVLAIGRDRPSHRETIDLGPWLDRFVSDFSDTQRLPPGAIRIDHKDLRALFNADHLYQILSNLCHNAIRHGTPDKGGTLIEIRAHDSGPDGRPQIDVVNRGPGIDANDREHLFEPFFTTHSRGTGLGLYIARELCDANGGQLRHVADAPDRTCFRVILPAAATRE
jgi:two-component system sensor histidine kinase PilS (NtrC family)